MSLQDDAALIALVIVLVALGAGWIYVSPDNMEAGRQVFGAVVLLIAGTICMSGRGR